MAAVGNNGKGVVGVNWTAKIIALKVLDDDRSGYISWTIDALNYLCTLIDQHPEMTLAAVNLSLGGWQSKSPEEMISSNDPSYLAYKALSDKNKAVICVAAGNESCEVGKPVNGMYVYPASFKNIANMIVVANAQNDSTYSKSSSSNYSTTYVDIAAPGTEILSTTPGNEYLSYSGTSMATPHVSGVAALLKSIFPEATASQIKAAINKGANGKYAKDYTAKGLLDAKKALQTLQETVATNLPPQILTTSLPSGLTDDAYDLRLSAKGARPMT
ncbi:MAG: S8 family serine peptidase [Synergistaceae bacterium]|nr:S8 family serine peptidase [Synergistaceae bacterium]